MRRLLLAAALSAAAAPAWACPPGAICPNTNPYGPGVAVYDQYGGYHGQLSSNPYAPDSTANRYGQYGNRYSPDSLNNPQTQQRLFGR